MALSASANPGRLSILTALLNDTQQDFVTLRKNTRMTDGNLTTHIKTLQQEGYIAVAKSYQNRRPLTTCALTKAGREAFTSGGVWP